jgi:uncharacterized protein YciI
MLAIVLLEYTVPLDEVLKHVGDHRAYLGVLHEQGKLLASGPFVPRTGGALLVSVESREELDAIVANDPFHQRGVARYEAREWAPTYGASELAALAVRRG